MQLVDLDDVIGLLERPVDVAVVVDPLPDDVGADGLMQHGSTGRNRGEGVDDRGQRLILDLDELRGVARGLTRVREHDGDRIALVANLVDRQAVLGNPSPGSGAIWKNGVVNSATSAPVSVA